MPALPRMVNNWQARSDAARSYACPSRIDSLCRPTIGVSRRLAQGGETEATRTSRQACTGSALPLSARGTSGSATTASRTRRQVGSPMTTPPGSAPAWRRAAVFIVSPMSGSPWAGTRTSPVLSPIRHCIGIGEPAARAPRRSTISAAALQARSASSSWATGRPNTAFTASPTNFSTRPPWRSTVARIASK